VDRPKFSEMKLDAKGILLLPKAIAAAKQGDDALLRFIVAFAKMKGLRRSASPRPRRRWWLAKARWAASHRRAEHRADILRAFKIVHALGTLDVGQAAWCEKAWLWPLRRRKVPTPCFCVFPLAKSLRGTPAKKRGVLVKALSRSRTPRRTCRWWRADGEECGGRILAGSRWKRAPP